MALTPRLELRQGQHLVMTPQLQQAIKLLQLSNLDLAAYVEQELEKNPLLERGEAAEADQGANGQETAPPADEGAIIATDQKIASGEVSDASRDLDTDYDNIYADDTKADQQQSAPPADLGSWASVRTSSGSFDDSENSVEATLTHAISLRDHLTEQLTVAIKDPTRRMIGAYLIDMVNEAGYLIGEIADVAERLGTSAAEVESVLAELQHFDPPGVMARSLSECLTLQLKDMGRHDPYIERLLANLDLLARQDIQALLRICGCDEEDLAEMIREIRLLNPKPGLAFGHEIIQPVVPDVFVRETTDGAWTVELNADTLPRVLINSRYYSSVSRNTQSKDAKAYLTDCLNNANWLVKSLDQRAKTILKVATEIVRQQDAFLALGVQHLRPLNLRTIADAISMHESTVSRVTANKYMATPRGVFEFKYFFTSAISSANGGEAHSAEAVRHRIRQMIDGENGDTVLSDDRIVELLHEAGIEIARRTVAKYREAMGIPSSVQRRRLKRVSA
ncbi:MAG TPA: RNA polymerase factor sigma-54 [Alphaproteobacteria bacterium]|nr:RNA polymerase factor sigma-54 [Alphaproteobacteria bacterium]